MTSGIQDVRVLAAVNGTDRQGQRDRDLSTLLNGNGFADKVMREGGMNGPCCSPSFMITEIISNCDFKKNVVS